MLLLASHGSILDQNNDGYSLERTIQDNIYNDIQSWKYHMLPEVVGGKRGYDCTTEDQLEHALKTRDTSQLSFIEVHTGKWDVPPGLHSISCISASTDSFLIPNQSSRPRELRWLPRTRERTILNDILTKSSLLNQLRSPILPLLQRAQPKIPPALPRRLRDRAAVSTCVFPSVHN